MISNYTTTDNSKINYWRTHKSDAILDYISDNSPTTDNKVVEFMTKYGISSRVTVLKLLHMELIPEGKVIDKKEGNSFHRLYINDKSEYQSLINRINNLSKAVSELTIIINNPSFKTTLQNIKTTPEGIIHTRDIMYLAQVELYKAIDAIYRDILMSEKLTRESDRQTLYIRLLDALVKSKGFTILLDAGASENMWEKFVQLGYPESKESKIIRHIYEIIYSMRMVKVDEDFNKQMLKIQSEFPS